MEAIREILQFLELDARIELKSVALDNVLGLTGSEDGIGLLRNVKELYLPLAAIAYKDKSEALRKDAALALINLSADKDTALKMVDSGNLSEQVIVMLWSMIKDEVYPSADPACMVLSNLTIEKMACDSVMDIFKKKEISMTSLVDFLCREPSPPKDEKEKPKPKLHYLGPLLSNLSQLPEVRDQFLAENCSLFTRLMPFTEYTASSVRRGGVIGAIRNCCFDTNVHEELLNKIDLLPRLLLPLAGPTPDSFDEKEIEELPIDLQYLDEDKKIEEDGDIRKLLLEALLQLCSTKKAREIIRDQNAYLILRELHKVEKDETVKLACEDVVDILIKKEDEINFDNYKTVEVPEDVQKKMENL